MKVLILGASGVVGSAVLKEGERRGLSMEVITREQICKADGLKWQDQLDLTDGDRLTRLILDRWPEVIINCVGTREAGVLGKALLVELPERLAQLSFHIGARLIHLSSDEVFPGLKGPYRSTDNTAAFTPRGRLQAEAEHKVLKSNPEDCIILRLGPVLGNSLKGTDSFHEQCLQAVADKTQLSFPNCTIRQPVSALNLAEVIVELAERRDLRGLFHWAGKETCSHFELAKKILEHFKVQADKIEHTLVLDDGSDESKWPKDLRLVLPPLQGKVRAEPESIRFALKQLQVPKYLLKVFHPELFG